MASVFTRLASIIRKPTTETALAAPMAAAE
jgi:hypothetical protein